MYIEAKKLDPGYFKKYGKLSIKMYWKALPQWIFLFGLLYLLGQVKINFIINSIIGVWTILLGLEIANNAYNAEGWSFSSFANSFKSSVYSWAHHMKTRKVGLFLMIGMYLVLNFFLERNATDVELMAKAKRIEENWSIFYNAAWGFVVGSFILGNGLKMGAFSHLLIKFFGDMEEKNNVKLTFDAATKNMDLTMMNEAFWFAFLAFLGSLVFIYVGILILFPLYANFIYLSFRGIFMKDKGLELKEKVKIEVNNLVIR